VRRVEVPHLPEEEREHDHVHHGLDHRPQHAERRLLVANLQVALREEDEQLAVAPQLRQPEPDPAGRRTDDVGLDQGGGSDCHELRG